MRINKFNENISEDELKENLEFSLVELVDDGYHVRVSYKDSYLIVVIREDRKDVKYTSIIPIYEYLEQLIELTKHYNKVLESVQMTTSRYNSIDKVKFLDKNIGKVTDAPLNDSSWEDLKDSIDFHIFKNDGEVDMFHGIRLDFK